MNDTLNEAVFTLREKGRKVQADVTRLRKSHPDEDLFRKVQGLLGQIDLLCSRRLEKPQ